MSRAQEANVSHIAATFPPDVVVTNDEESIFSSRKLRIYHVNKYFFCLSFF